MRTGRVRTLPENRDNNGWYRLLPPPPAARPVAGERRVDWAVVGAGCCGLAAARRLAELRPDDTLAVVEAERLGFGASGRNSGFMLNVHATGAVKDLELIRRQSRLWQAGLDWLRALVESHQIRCEWSEWGRVYAAAGDEGERHLGDLERLFASTGVELRTLDAEAMAAQTGSRFYRRGIHVAGSALVQPAALMRGLGSTLPANVAVHEESPVLEVARASAPEPGWRLRCPEGTVRARRVIFAAGVYLGDVGALPNRVVPLGLYASLTRALTPEERARIGAGDELGILPASPNGSTLRLTRDGRILMRNWTEYAPAKRFPDATLAHARSEHRRAIAARWPALAEVPIEHTWGGLMGVTRNEGRLFEAVGDDAWALGTSDHSPVVRGTIAGKLLAEHLAGEDSELLRLQLALPPANYVPPDPILGFIARRRLRRVRREGAAEI